MWEGVHCNGHVTNDHGLVHRHPQPHVVDRLVRLPGALALYLKSMRFGIDQFTFNVPKSVIPQEALVSNAARVLQCAWMGGGQWQGGTF